MRGILFSIEMECSHINLSEASKVLDCVNNCDNFHYDLDGFEIDGRNAMRLAVETLQVLLSDS